MSKQIHVRLPDDLHAWLTTHAKRTRQPINALFTHIVRGARHAHGTTPGEVVLEDLDYWIEEGDYDLPVGEYVKQRIIDALLLFPIDQRHELNEKYDWLFFARDPRGAIQEHRDQREKGYTVVYDAGDFTVDDVGSEWTPLPTNGPSTITIVASSGVQCEYPMPASGVASLSALIAEKDGAS